MTTPIKLTVLLLISLLWQAVAEDINAIDYDTRTISYFLEAEPPTLDTMDEVTSASAMISGHTFEGLMTYNDKKQLVGGVAKKWEISSDGLKYTFYLRKNAKWSDGKTVTAHDFEFAWKEVINPEKASKYVFIMYPLKNAEKANAQKAGLDTVGVKAIDDFTLEVELDQPCGYFLSLTTFVTYMPCRKEFYQEVGKEHYASKPENLLYNGPFEMTSWKHSSSIKLSKNEQYWNKEKVWLEHINFNYLIKDKKALFNLYNDSKICMAYLDDNTVKQAMKNHFTIKKANSGVLAYMEFNHREGRYTSNENFRKAIQYTFNPYEYVFKVVGVPGNKPGHSLFPHWLMGVKNSFRKEYPLTPIVPNPAQAQEYLNKAKQELGVEQFEAITFLISDSPNARKDAEYLQEKLRKTLGLEIKLDVQVFKQRLAKSFRGEFDLLGGGWGPDYNDPMTFGDLFASFNQNNRGRFINEEYDKQIRIAQQETDQKKRMAAFAKCQQIIQDRAGILPMSERGEIYIQHPRLINVIRNVVGPDPVFIYAEITPKEAK